MVIVEKNFAFESVVSSRRTFFTIVVIAGEAAVALGEASKVVAAAAGAPSAASIGLQMTLTSANSSPVDATSSPKAGAAGNGGISS